MFLNYSNSITKEKQFEDLLEYTLAVNKRVEQEKINSESNTEEAVVTEPIYSDGKSALISSYSEIYNSKSFYLESTGSMSLEMLGISLKVDMDYTVIRFNEKCNYLETSNYLNSTNAPSALRSAIENSTNVAKRVYKKDGVSYFIDTDSFKNKKPDFTNKPVKIDNSLVILPESLFIINEESINAISYYKIKYNKGIIKNYYVQADINCEKALPFFSKYIEQSAKCIKEPTFNKFIMTACLNGEGKMIGLNIDCDVILCRDTPIGVKNCPCNMKLNFALNSLNEKINYEVEGF